MNNTLITVGWREWASLPDLGLPWLKAKVDSGRKTSILHTPMTEHFVKDGVPMVRFGLHPHQNDRDIAVLCEAPVAEERIVHNMDRKRDSPSQRNHSADRQRTVNDKTAACQPRRHEFSFAIRAFSH